ncbi:MAG: UDP-glucose--hexose-1-phosphate uridylyltransferase [Candidatus Acidiferrales bacterium]
MSEFQLQKHPHRRLNALTREWVLVSPHRTQRPWLGQIEERPSPSTPSYDPACYMCPGNRRAGGAQNPVYPSTYVFDNDYPALLPDTPAGGCDVQGLLVAKSESGLCRVMCFSPLHDRSLSQMKPAEVRQVVDVWTDQHKEMGAMPLLNYVQIFENRGAMMGCSNPHPHCQIWGSASIPNEPLKELAAQSEYLSRSGSCLLCGYVAAERLAKERMVIENEHFMAVVPFWAVWPFEVLVLPLRHIATLEELSSPERDSLARILRQLTSAYDRMFDVAFPYSMGFHSQPTDGPAHPEWHMHAHFFPPLLRSATVRKFMVGYEMLGTPQRDITAETAAERLREKCAANPTPQG